jgi:hypothetical protein
MKWVFLCFGFTEWRLVNCFHLSIPFWTGDIPLPLVDVATATPDKAVKFVTEEARSPVTREKG